MRHRGFCRRLHSFKRDQLLAELLAFCLTAAVHFLFFVKKTVVYDDLNRLCISRTVETVAYETEEGLVQDVVELGLAHSLELSHAVACNIRHLLLKGCGRTIEHLERLDRYSYVEAAFFAFSSYSICDFVFCQTESLEHYILESICCILVKTHRTGQLSNNFIDHIIADSSLVAFFDVSQYGSRLGNYKPDWTFALKNRFAISKTCTATLNINYQTREYAEFIISKPQFSMAASIAKSFFSEALTIRLYASDIFKTYREQWTMYGQGVDLYKDCYNYTRRVGLIVTYNLNPSRSKYKGTGAGNDEKNRL